MNHTPSHRQRWIQPTRSSLIEVILKRRRLWYSLKHSQGCILDSVVLYKPGFTVSKKVKRDCWKLGLRANKPMRMLISVHSIRKFLKAINYSLKQFGQLIYFIVRFRWMPSHWPIQSDMSAKKWSTKNISRDAVSHVLAMHTCDDDGLFTYPTIICRKVWFVILSSPYL